MAASDHQPGFVDGLTVIVLTYDSATTVADCLDSLVAQSDPDFEVIVVDDASRDATVHIVEAYRPLLRLRVIANGSHVIAKGRNLGLAAAETNLVAYLDSDDRAHQGWVEAIKDTVARHPDASIFSGALVPLGRTAVAKAIATNDEAIRRFFGQGAVRFRGGNCAFNRSLYPDVRFNEEFRYAEDLELVYRSQPRHRWVHTTSMRVEHSSRDTLQAYATQMYRYGRAKAYVSYRSGDHRAVDYGPLLVCVAGAALALRKRSVFPALALVPFSLAEGTFVALAERCRPREAALLAPAWSPGAPGCSPDSARSQGTGNCGACFEAMSEASTGTPTPTEVRASLPQRWDPGSRCSGHSRCKARPANRHGYLARRGP